MTKYPNGLDGVKFCDRCKNEIVPGKEKTHTILIYGKVVVEDICPDCRDKMYPGVHMKCCSSCGSIQKASIECPLCGSDTGE